MKIPNLPNLAAPLITESRTMHPVWHMFFNQLIQEMQSNTSQEGIKIPSQTTENISKIQAASPLSSIISNEKNGDVYISINGVFEKINTTPISLQDLL